MPTNLNALIRYKRIDSCLRNPYITCTIAKLQETCSEAMGEFRGIYKLVSERTIRDDIRVLRSNILGFNAPIEIKDGNYIYTDKEYSIFKTPVTEFILLKDIFNLLIEERNNIADSEIDKLLERISIIVGEPLPFEITKDKIVPDIRRPRMMFSLSSKAIDESALEIDENVNDYSCQITIPVDKQVKPLLLWDEILAVC